MRVLVCSMCVFLLVCTLIPRSAGESLIERHRKGMVAVDDLEADVVLPDEHKHEDQFGGPGEGDGWCGR